MSIVSNLKGISSNFMLSYAYLETRSNQCLLGNCTGNRCHKVLQSTGPSAIMEMVLLSMCQPPMYAFRFLLQNYGNSDKNTFSDKVYPNLCAVNQLKWRHLEITICLGSVISVEFLFILSSRSFNIYSELETDAKCASVGMTL